MNLSGLLEMQGMLLLLMVLGLFLYKIGLIDDSGKRLLTDLVIYVTLPASIVKSFLIEFNKEILMNCLMIFIVAIVIQFGTMFLGLFLFPGFEEGKKKVMQYATICSNAGVLGNPVAEGAFGSLGLMYASIYLIPQRTFMWSAGLTYFTESPSRKELIKKIVTHPCIVAVAVGLVLMLSQLPLPGVIDSTVRSVANANTSVSMILIGTILAEMDFKKLIDKDSLYYCVIRLGLVPGLVYLGCRLFQINTMVTGVSVLLAAMPAASTTAILAAKYKKDEVFAAKIVSLSTILSVLTAPLWCLLFA